MTKPRQPLSIEEALHETYGALGMETARAVTGKGDSMLRAWADPDRDDYKLPLHQAMALDRASIGAGHGRAPLLAVYQAAIRQQRADSHVPQAPANHMCELTQRLGDVAGELRAAVSVTGDGGVEITERERASILAEIEEMEAALADLKHDLSPPAASNVTAFAIKAGG